MDTGIPLYKEIKYRFSSRNYNKFTKKKTWRVNSFSDTLTS